MGHFLWSIVVAVVALIQPAGPATPAEPAATTTQKTGVAWLGHGEPLVLGAGGSERWEFVPAAPPPPSPTTPPPSTSGPSAKVLSFRIAGASTAVLEIQVEEPARMGTGRRLVGQPIGKIELFDDGVSVYATWTRADAFPKGLKELPAITVREQRTGRTMLLRPLAVGSVGSESVVFVLDASGSMRGSKLQAAKKALLAAYSGLANESEAALFVLYNCGDVVQESTFGSPTDSFRAAVDRVEARGGTPLGDAMDLAFRYLHDKAKYPEDRRRMILLSDGMATCGRSPGEVCRAWPAGLRSSQKLVIVGLELGAQDERVLQELATDAGGAYMAADQQAVESVMLKATGGSQPKGK